MTEPIDVGGNESPITEGAIPNGVNGVDMPTLAYEYHRLRGEAHFADVRYGDGHDTLGYVYLEVDGTRYGPVIQRTLDNDGYYASAFSTFQGWPRGSTVVAIYVDLDGNEFRSDAPPEGIVCLPPTPNSPGLIQFYYAWGTENDSMLRAAKILTVFVLETTFQYPQETPAPVVPDVTVDLVPLVDPGPLDVQGTGQVLRFT